MRERSRLTSRIVALAVLSTAAGATPRGQDLAALMASVKPAGEVLAIANDYVRVTYVALEYQPAGPPAAESRPVVVYVRIDPAPGILNSQPLVPPRGARPAWRPGVVARGIRIELLAEPPSPSALLEPDADLPRDAREDAQWQGGRLILATFASGDYVAGTGRFPSVTTFLSDGVVDFSSRGVRRRMGVRAGDAFWFEAGTRVTVVSDDPVGAAIVQLYPRRRD